MQITITPEQAQLLRSLGAKINGALGGQAKSANKLKAARRNVRRATKASLKARMEAAS
jgi:hypothetical protein